MNTHFNPSRRNVLIGGGALVVSFSFAASSVPAQDTAAAKSVAKDEVDAFLAIDAKGTVTVYSGKVDLGTGVPTALAQMVAEELDVPLASIDMITGDTALTPDQGTTSGSFSIQNGGVQIRQAAATARNALLTEAAQRLGVGKDDLIVADGKISDKSGGKSVTYAELIGGREFALKLDSTAPVKSPATFKIVGKSIARDDIPDRMTGRFTYMQDFRVPGMLHGRVVHPPAIGAKLESIDEGSISNIPGIVKVVQQGNLLAVIAQNEWAAIKGARQLKATWSKAATLPDQAKLWEHVRATKVVKEEVTGNVGDTAAAMAGEGKKLSASYDFAIHTHGSIGPSCAIAEFKDGKLTSWSASQATHALRRQLAEMFAMPAENIRCIYVEGAGCYGRNGHEDAFLRGDRLAHPRHAAERKKFAIIVG
jgi:nicotinate dehydrogenase subunit B